MINMKNRKKEKIISAFLMGLVLFGVFVSGCVEERTTVTIKGSTTVLPVAEGCAEVFNKQNEDVKVIVAGGGSSLGIKSVANGEADIGDASREVKPSEIQQYSNVNFVDNKVALDGVAVIVSKDIYDSRIIDLTLDQVKGIFNGSIDNWNQVGGPDSEIFVNEREEGSGTRSTFMENVGLEETTADKSSSSNSAVKQAVKGSNKAIGYTGLGYVDSSTPGIAINGVEPTSENIKAGSYPLSRSLHMYTNGEPTGAVKDFLDFVLSEEGQQIVEQEGFISVN